MRRWRPDRRETRAAACWETSLCGAVYTSSGTVEKLSLLRRFVQLGANSFGCERDLTEPDSDRIEDRVADRRRDGGRRGFAGAHRRQLTVVDKNDLDLRHVAELDDWVCAPVQILDAGGVEVDLFHQRPAASLNDVALNLIAHTVRVDDDAAVVRDG